jgi:hypothetical protein
LIRTVLVVIEEEALREGGDPAAAGAVRAFRAAALGPGDDADTGAALQAAVVERLASFADPDRPGPLNILAAEVLAAGQERVDWSALARWIRRGDDDGDDDDRYEVPHVPPGL